MTEMDSEELSWLAAYDRLEGLPDSWLQTGVIAATIANAFRGKKSKAATPSDFMPRRQRKPLSAAETIKVLRASASAANKRFDHGNYR